MICVRDIKNYLTLNVGAHLFMGTSTFWSIKLHLLNIKCRFLSSTSKFIHLTPETSGACIVFSKAKKGCKICKDVDMVRSREKGHRDRWEDCWSMAGDQESEAGRDPALQMSVGTLLLLGGWREEAGKPWPAPCRVWSNQTQVTV